MEKVKKEVTKDNTPVNVFAKKYLLNEISESQKTDFICKKTQSPEKPRAKDVKESLIISGKVLEAVCLIPVVISKRHNKPEQPLPSDKRVMNFEITENIII